MPPSVTTNYGRTRSFLNELTLISYLGITRSSPASAAAATDECTEGTSCCSDNDGSFTCACKSGYRLQNDKKSCDGEYFDQIKLCGVNLSNDLH